MSAVFYLIHNYVRKITDLRPESLDQQVRHLLSLGGSHRIKHKTMFLGPRVRDRELKEAIDREVEFRGRGSATVSLRPGKGCLAGAQLAALWGFSPRNTLTS